ncbi:uncharacterized protein LOC107405278 [Ziziphus jujuba]|uniref:Uncharacterized protein LOC107405278 n=1 Tax=Ziziphus jujuba TaxID=326968 RepID=A0A6P3YVE7_ZIZJJ|nr:uncharacterized protein LOC107405278 [Ziziphus jujuba]
MEEKEKKKKINNQNKKQKHQHPNDQTTKTSDFSFKPSSDVKGIRFGGQFIVKSFTIRRARPLELLQLLSFPPTTSTTIPTPTPTPTNNTNTNTITNNYSGNKSNTKNANNHKLLFPSTTAFLPTNFTILAHHVWRTLTLRLGTKKSKVLLFMFETESMKVSVDGVCPSEIPLGEVNKRPVRGLTGCEMARFKFRKGCVK